MLFCQVQGKGLQATSLMECGPAQDDQTRKWIMDLDGKLDDLRALQFLKQDEECTEEVQAFHMFWGHLLMIFLTA